jgi:hypothetical protein
MRDRSGVSLEVEDLEAGIGKKGKKQGEIEETKLGENDCILNDRKGDI